MAATRRQERELKQKYEALLKKPDLEPLERARAFVMSKGVCSLKSLHRAFKKLDQTGDHKLSYKELSSGLLSFGVIVEPDVMRQIFDEMDKDGTGFLTYDEFLVALRPRMNQRRLALVHRAFNKLDRTGDQQITPEDLKGVYSATKHPKYLSGEWSEEDVFREWLNSFNGPDESGVVDREDFEEYYAGVSASIDSDAYFDLMMRNAWKL